MEKGTKFHSLKVRKLDFNFDFTSDNKNNKLTVSISYSPFFNDTYQKTFYLKFDINISNEAKDWNLNLEAYASFTTDFEIDDEFKGSDFVLTEAADMAFPYVRNYISLVTQVSGFNPIILNDVKFQDNEALKITKG